MWRSALRPALRALCIPFRQYARKAPSSGSLRKQIIYTTPFFLLETYRRHCRHPDLTRLAELRSSAPSTQDGQSSSSSQLTPQTDPMMSEEQCASIVHAPTLASALDGINDLLAQHAPSRTGTRPKLPTWLVLSALLKVPATPVEAFAVSRLALFQTHHAPELVPLLMSLSAYWLSQHRMYAPLRGMILRVLQFKDSLDAYQVSLLVRVLGQADTSREVQYLMSLLLDVALSRDFDLGVRTYRILLENPSASPRVAALVERHMHARMYTPNLSHTRAFLRIYGRGKRRVRASRKWRRIRAGEYHGPKAAYTTSPKQKSRMLEDYLHSMKTPKQMNMYVKYLLKNTARPRPDPRNVSPVTLPRPDGISHRIWLQALRTTAETTSIPAEELLAQFNAGKDHVGSPQKTLVAHFLVIKGLVRRRKYAKAAELLEGVLPQKDKFDGPKLTKAVEALTMANKPFDAFHLLLEFDHKQDSARPLSSLSAASADHVGNEEPVAWKSPMYTPHRQLVDTLAINSFMTCLLRIGRPDVVFYIWDTMPQVFRVEPDSSTFAILLKAAHYARKYEGALQVAIADFGMGRILPSRNTGAELHLQRTGRDDAVAGLEALLAPDAKHRVTGFWRGERAGEVALRVAWQVLVGNWPILATFSSPVRAIRHSADEAALSPITDFFHSFASRPNARLSESRMEKGEGEGGSAESGRTPGPVRPYDEDGRTFFSIVPDNAAFLALIHLLAAEERAHQVPLVLVWMRYLRVWAKRDLLATALVYWGEVALEGPWVQRMRQWRARERGAPDSEYMRLVKWITRWVGRKRMPREDDKHRALRRVKWYREFGARNSDAEWE